MLVVLVILSVVGIRVITSEQSRYKFYSVAGKSLLNVNIYKNVSLESCGYLCSRAQRCLSFSHDGVVCSLSASPPVETETPDLPIITTLVKVRCGAGDEWVETNFMKCLKYVKTLVSWEAAQEKCKAEGGELATFEDQEQMEYVTDVVPDLARDVIWIGGKRIGDSWYWINAVGNPRLMMITNWAYGEPQPLQEDCIFLYGYQWYNLPCDQLLPYICQRPYY